MLVAFTRDIAVIRESNFNEEMGTQAEFKTSFSSPATRIHLDVPNADTFFEVEAPCPKITEGTQIGDFVVMEQLGSGGMGVVLKAHDAVLDRLVAIKVISPTIAWNEAMVMRFIREARAMASIQHEAVMPILAWGKHEGLPYFVMPFTPGRTLCQIRQEEETISTDRLLAIASQVTSAIQAIHQAGLVHRDLKPSNIWMESETDAVKILDFGLVQEEECEGKKLTQVGMLTGTPGFMAPEQVLGEPSTHSTDLFSLGATLYYILEGEAPFVGKTPNAAAVATVSLPHNPLPKSKSKRQRELVDLIHQCLQKSPSDRPESATIVQERLQHLGKLKDPEAWWHRRGVLAILGAITIVTGLGVGMALSGPEVAPIERMASEGLESLQSTGIDSEDRTEIPLDTEVRLNTDVPSNAKLPAGATDSEMLGGTPPTEGPTHAAGMGSVGSQASLILQSPDVETNSIADSILQRAILVPEGRQAFFQALHRSSDPTLRTDLIHRSADYLSLAELKDMLMDEHAPDVMAALVQISAESAKRWSMESSDKGSLSEFANLLLRLSETHHDAEFQASCRWWFATLHPSAMSKRTPLTEPPRQWQGAVWFEPPSGPAMVAISTPGNVQLGSPLDEVGRKVGKHVPEHLRKVSLNYPLAVSATEVTYAHVREMFDDALPNPYDGTDQEPVRAISWGEAAEFCNRLSEQIGLGSDQFCYRTYQASGRWYADEHEDALTRTGYRMPTDSEWEFACRAGASTIRSFGDGLMWLNQYAVVGSGGDTDQGTPTFVASRKPNQFGLFDTHGNISEWTQDRIWIDSIRHRRVRGGSVFTAYDGIRSAARYNINERMWPTHHRIGLRVARTLPSTKPLSGQ